MCELVYYELKKLFTDAAAKYVCGFLAVLVFMNSYQTISRYFFHSGERQGRLWFAPYHGLEAIKKYCEKFYYYETELTAEKVRQVFTDELKLLADFEQEAERNKWSLSRWNAEKERVFCKLRDIHPYELCLMVTVMSPEISDIKRIQKNIEEIIPEDFYQSKLFNGRVNFWPYLSKESEKVLVQQKLNRLPIPYKVTYCEGWRVALGRIEGVQRWIPACVLLLIMLILKYETESGMMDLILATKYGKSKAVYAKLLAALLIVTVANALVYFSYLISVLSAFGFKGWNIQIQTCEKMHESIYNLQYLSFFLVQFALGWLLSVFIVLVGFFVFSLCQQYIIALIVAGSMFYFPVAATYVSTHSRMHGMTGSDKLLSLVGINAMKIKTNFVGLIPDGEFIYFFGAPVLRVYGFIMIYAGLSLILAVLIVMRYRHMRIKN